eukprot:m.47050 g.47050  ORF g.47050 m.47050 type:complete len:470 (-) comp12600_c0_seq1:137-1546(-)
MAAANDQHQQSQQLVCMQAADGKGLGLFACVRLSRGQLVLEEQPLMRAPLVSPRFAEHAEALADSLDWDAHEMLSPLAYWSLTPEDQQKVLALHSRKTQQSLSVEQMKSKLLAGFAELKQRAPEFGPYSKACFEQGMQDFATYVRVFEILCANGREQSNGDTALFERACRINSSCDPNCVQVDGRLRALTSIAKGAELTVCYLSPFHSTLPLLARQAALHNWSFMCKCTRCEREATTLGIGVIEHSADDDSASAVLTRLVGRLQEAQPTQAEAKDEGEPALHKRPRHSSDRNAVAVQAQNNIPLTKFSKEAAAYQICFDLLSSLISDTSDEDMPQISGLSLHDLEGVQAKLASAGVSDKSHWAHCLTLLASALLHVSLDDDEGPQYLQAYISALEQTPLSIYGSIHLANCHEKLGDALASRKDTDVSRLSGEVQSQIRRSYEEAIRLCKRAFAPWNALKIKLSNFLRHL